MEREMMSSGERIQGLKIDHIGVAVENLQNAIRVFEQNLGGQLLYQTESDEQKMVSAKMRLGQADFELMEPISPDGPVGKFVAKRGAGIHHVSIQTPNLDETVEELQRNGVETGKVFCGKDYRVVFIHPKDALGILIELIERAENRG
jgi:methylmalonyl-CoA/ethylmalonyl-CoA epimerase